ncbi:MAG: hypothetical protein AB1665_05600 [Candidatus Thermoplasmatota archaeon]
MVEKSKVFEGKKFMWNGCTYASEVEARNAEDGYKRNGFETKIAQEENRHLVYTRRTVKEVRVEGPAPL